MAVSWVLYLLVILIATYNAHSLPFVWHARVLLPVVRLFRRKKDAAALIRTVRGQDPSKIKILVSGYRVWPSDVDYNMHKSNSTYASDMDVARSTAATELFGPFLASGGLLPIAGTTHRFLHELSPLAKYDVEISFGGWGEKWMYAVGKFVTRPSGKQASKEVFAQNKRAVRKRKDGSVVHAVSVSIFCFKLGRLTIPPAVVLSICGYGSASDQARCFKLHSQGPKSIIGYLKGGWKDDDEAVESVESYRALSKRLGNEGDVMQKALESFGLEDDE